MARATAVPCLKSTSQQGEINFHFAGLNWPPPIEIASENLKADTTKALYQAQLQLMTIQQQGYIDHDKAVRTSDYAFHQAVFQAYLDVAKGQIERSVTRTQFLTTAASAIGTIYARNSRTLIRPAGPTWSHLARRGHRSCNLSGVIHCHGSILSGVYHLANPPVEPEHDHKNTPTNVAASHRAPVRRT